MVLALCLFIGEIAIRQLLLPSAWTTPRQRHETSCQRLCQYAYGELEAIVHHRAEERRRRTTRVRWPAPVRLPLTRPGIFIWPVCGIGGGNPETFYAYCAYAVPGVRYSAQCLPHLGEIMTPPYDVINEAERAAYMARSPYNMIHLILGAEYRIRWRTIGFPGRRGCCKSGDQSVSRPRAPASALSLPARIFRAWCARYTYRRH